MRSGSRTRAPSWPGSRRSSGELGRCSNHETVSYASSVGPRREWRPRHRGRATAARCRVGRRARRKGTSPLAGGACRCGRKVCHRRAQRSRPAAQRPRQWCRPARRLSLLYRSRRDHAASAARRRHLDGDGLEQSGVRRPVRQPLQLDGRAPFCRPGQRDPGDACSTQRRRFRHGRGLRRQQSGRRAGPPRQRATGQRPARLQGPRPPGRQAREWYFVKRALDKRPAVLLARRGAGVDHTTAAANFAALVELVAHVPGRAS